MKKCGHSTPLAFMDSCTDCAKRGEQLLARINACICPEVKAARLRGEPVLCGMCFLYNCITYGPKPTAATA
jgi:hypothetical protein